MLQTDWPHCPLIICIFKQPVMYQTTNCWGDRSCHPSRVTRVINIKCCLSSDKELWSSAGRKQSSGIKNFLPRWPLQLCYVFLLLCRGSGHSCEPALHHATGSMCRAAVASPIHQGYRWGRREEAEYGYRGDTHRSNEAVLASVKSHRQSSSCLTMVKSPQTLQQKSFKEESERWSWPGFGKDYTWGQDWEQKHESAQVKAYQALAEVGIVGWPEVEAALSVTN